MHRNVVGNVAPSIKEIKLHMLARVMLHVDFDGEVHNKRKLSRLWLVGKAWRVLNRLVPIKLVHVHVVYCHANSEHV